MPAKSITFHVGGGQAYRAHNGRYYKPGQSPDHVKDARRGDNETIVDIDHRRAYQELFSEAVDAYNDRQKRADRKISDYYKQTVKDGTRHPVYEVIVQIGDKDDTGLHDCKAERAVLKEFIDGWETRNPQMKLVGAYLHADETTLHAHIDFIPWADGYKRGPERQCSISRACEQMGHAKGEHFKETAQAAWTASERQFLEELAQSHGIEVKHVRLGRLHEADKEVFIAERMAKEASEKAASLRDEQMGLLLDTYRLRAEARGVGYEYISTAEVEALRAEAAQAGEAIAEAAVLRSEKADLFDIIRSDEELEARFRLALDRWAEAEPSDLEADREALEL